MRDRRAAAVAVVVTAVAVGSVTAAVTLVPQQGEVTTKTPTNLTVRVSEPTGLPSGNPFTSRGIELPHVVVAAGEGGAITVEESSGRWTNTSNISVGQTDIRINRTDARPVNVSGTVERLHVQQINLSDANSTAELRATAGGDWVLQIEDTGVAQGRGLVVIDEDTGTVLDARPVDGSGTVRFNELTAVGSPGSPAPLNVKRGASELLVFQETRPEKLADDATLRIRFIQSGSQRVVEREVTNGQVDLTGVPKDQRVSVTVDQQDNGSYAYRRITLRNVQQQQEVYLLNVSRADVTPIGVVFQLEDRTGEFPPSETTLKIQKPVTKDFDSDGANETRFQTIAGDIVGATGEFPVTLAADNRYRLTVINSEGDRRVLGSYVARQSERSTIRIGRVSFDVQGERGFAVDFSTVEKDSDNDGTDELFARVVYRDPSNRTEEFSYELSNGTGIVLSDTVTGPLGNYTATLKIADNATKRAADDWRLNWTVVRENENGVDETITGSRYAGDVRGIAGVIPVEGRWLSLIGWVGLVALTGLVVVFDAAVASVVAVLLGTALTLLGVLGIPLPALGLGGVVSVMAMVGRSRR